MPISILPQDKDGQELFNAISSFFRTFEVTIHGGVHLNQAQSERFYLHPNRPRLT